jgi:hypothetical protein
MGDFTLHLHLKVYRSTQTLNARGKLLFAMLTKLNLCAVNTEASCVGQTNTYISSCGVSMIDYIVIEKHLTPCINHVEIMDETPDNTAFHLPVFLHLELDEMNEILLPCFKQQIAWSKCTTNHIEMYNGNLANLLPSEFSPQTLFETPDEIDA